MCALEVTSGRQVVNDRVASILGGSLGEKEVPGESHLEEAKSYTKEFRIEIKVIVNS